MDPAKTAVSFYLKKRRKRIQVSIQDLGEQKREEVSLGEDGAD